VLVVGRSEAARRPDLLKQNFTLDRLPSFDPDTHTFNGPDATIRVESVGGGTGPTALARPAALGITRRTGKAGAAGAAQVSTQLANVRPGRLLTGTQQRKLATHVPAGTQVSFVLPLASLTQGTNTLTVVVIDRGGTRYQQIVSFGAAAPARDRPGKPPIRLPDRPGIAVGRPRVPVAPAIGAGAAASLEKLAKATALVKDDAARTLVRFRRNRP
jgi:hypothetical protein